MKNRMKAVRVKGKKGKKLGKEEDDSSKWKDENMDAEDEERLVG